jgi:uncharacterized protein (TIGR02145 family)
MRKISCVLAFFIITIFARSQENTFIDRRDGSVYKTVTLVNKTWLAENLKFKTDNSWCYKDLNLSCQAFGRLYTWEDASLACPEGWTLPDDDDFNSLITFYKDDRKLANAALIAGGDSGFEALMSGGRTCEGEYQGLLQHASYWSSFDRKKKYSNCLEFYTQGLYVFIMDGYKCAAKSVRCIKKD